MSSSRTYQSPKSSNSGPSFLKIRSPFASLFSFRKSKHEVKLPEQQERYNNFPTLNRQPPSTEPIKKKFEIYQSARSVKQIANFFESHQKKPSQSIPSDVQLQREAFQVLGDLDQKLAQEQSYSHPLRTGITPTYKYGSIYSKESLRHNTSDSRKDYSTLSSHGRRPSVSLGESHTTHATYQPRRFYEMYSVRHQSASTSEEYNKTTYAKSPSLCSDSSSKSGTFSPISGKFSSSSLNLESETLHERTRQQKPRRIPITSIRWNKSSASSQPEVPGRLFRTQSALDLTNSRNTPQQNRISDLYKYNNSNRVPSSGIKDFHKGGYRNDLTYRPSQNNSDKWSAGYYKTDSCGLGSATRFSTQTSSRWKEENKENSFKVDNVTSQPPLCTATKTDKDTEPMEVINEYDDSSLHGQAENCVATRNISNQLTLNIHTKNISAKSDRAAVDIEPGRENMDLSPQNMGFTLPSECEKQAVRIYPGNLSKLEPMEVDVPRASLSPLEQLPSSAKDLRNFGSSDQKDSSLSNLQKHSSYTGPLFTNQSRATFAFQSSKRSVEPNTLNKDYSPSRDLCTFSKPKSIAENLTTYRNTSTDIAKRLVMLRWGSKDNILEGHGSDMLKNQKRNASSLPDLIDQKNYLCHKDDSSPTIKSQVKAIDSSLTNMSNTEDTKGFATAYKMSSGNNFSTHDFRVQREDSNLRTLDSLEKVKRCSFDPEVDRKFKGKEQSTPVLKTVSSTDTITEADGIKEVVHLPETAPSYLDVHNRFKSIYTRNRPNYVQHEADTNNNRPFPKTVQSIEEGSEADRSDNIFTDPKKDSFNIQKMKTPNYGMFPNSRRFMKDEKDVTEKNQQNIDRGEQHVETEKEFTRNILNRLNQKGTNKKTEINEQSRIQSITVIPTNQIVEEHLQRMSCTEDDTEKRSLNLLKERLLLAPEPYKKSGNTKEDTNPPFYGSGLSPNIYTCESQSENIKSAETNSVSEVQQTSKTYSSEGITERTQIYETCFTDSSKPDVDTVEYHKVVSIYYTLPRNYTKRQPVVSQNNKNVDQTLANSQVPSSRLEKITNKRPEAEENHDFNDQNMGKTSPSHCTPESVMTKELSSEMPLSQQHLLNFNLIPLQTNIANKNTKPFPDTKTESTDFSLADQFSSLHISQSGCGHTDNDLQRPKNINEYSPTRTSPRHTQNACYTLPNRRSNLQDLERSILENDVAMARNRYNLYSKRGNTFPTTPESQDVFLSPTIGHDNLNFTGGCSSTNFQEKEVNDLHNYVKKDDLCNKDSFCNEVLYREDIPALYKSKSIKDLNRRESPNSPGMEPKLSPQSLNQPYVTKGNEPMNRTRPSYTSEFVQKKMKPINAKKFTFSFDNAGQRESSNSRSSESFGESARQSDLDSPSVFYSPKDNSPSHVSRHNYGQGRPAERTSSPPSNMYRSKSLKSLNHDYKEEEVEIRRKSDGNFSSKSYGENIKGRQPKAINSGDGKGNRRYSSEMIIDENDNLPSSSTGNSPNPVYTSKSIDYGIFGKEQQEALLKNVKRSLTEGRLWRPSFLKNPSSLRTEESYTSQESHQTDCKPNDDMKETLHIYEDEVPPNSESDTDTTTDDEYYLDEHDKESEL